MLPPEPSVLIASNVAPVYVGGLSAYIRALTEGITRITGHTGASVFLDGTHPQLPLQSQRPPWPLLKLLPTPLGRLFRPFWAKMASRRWFHFLLVELLRRSWGFSSDLRPSVIHFVGTGWDYLGFALASHARKCGAQFTIWPAVHPGQWGDDVIDIRLYREADAVFCQSEFERAHLKARGVSESALVRCGLFPMNRPDGNVARFRERHHLANRPCVLFLGRADAGKGYPALREAWEIVKAIRPEAVLLIGGPNPEKNDLENSDHIKHLGLLDEAEKADAQAACDIFCLPSAHESFGIVYVEAWFYSKPVICGTAPASRELIEDGVTGRWSDQDPKNLAECLLGLLNDPKERKRLGENGKRLQEEAYTESIFLKKHLDIFRLKSEMHAVDH